LGTERAHRFARLCTYYGTAPVSLEDYIASVHAQSIRKQRPLLEEVRRALADLVVDDEIVSQLGEALNLGLGFFLHGAPGNGKTSIAERIVHVYGDTIWIPRAIHAAGETIRLFDGRSHEAQPLENAGDGTAESPYDKRWVRIRRPTIVVGGELILENMEITKNPRTGICEAPLQLKSNCGTLVIDDFGRQQVSPSDMLNRWIVPLEKRHDYLSLTTGRKLQVPFDQVVIFSSNLDPSTLVDEAFLRRIPYKIEVHDPTESQFRKLFRETAAEKGLVCAESFIDYLIETHFKPARRTFRFCHPRSLVQQIDIYCQFRRLPPVVTSAAIDAAVRNYFAMG
jgi:predicted ATPase with chaperone activity